MKLIYLEGQHNYAVGLQHEKSRIFWDCTKCYVVISSRLIKSVD